jgi:exonuclease VII small subunit
MSCFRFSFCLTVLALASVLSVSSPAQAQTSALAAQRQAVFEQLLSSPTDRALMQQYARLSVQMRDFEAAAATLERVVDLEPENVGARLELAIAYFALGAYDVARHHLTAAEASGALTPEQAERAARYSTEADGRDTPQRLSGEIAIGQGRTDDGTVSDSGVYGSVRLDWRIDMGGPNANDWLTQLRFDSVRPGAVATDRRGLAQLRTGPELRLTGDLYGPRLQPYIEFTRLRDGASFGTFGHDAVALGVAYQNPHSALWTSFADIQIGRGEPVDPSAGTFDFVEAMAGATYRPSRETRIRGTLGWFDADYSPTATRTETSAQIDVLQTVQIDALSLPRRWEIGGTFRFADVEDDRFGDFTDRYLGASIRAFVTDDVFIEVRGARLQRDFSTRFDTEETFYGLQIGWEF